MPVYVIVNKLVIWVVWYSTQVIFEKQTWVWFDSHEAVAFPYVLWWEALQAYLLAPSSAITSLMTIKWTLCVV